MQDPARFGSMLMWPRHAFKTDKNRPRHKIWQLTSKVRTCAPAC